FAIRCASKSGSSVEELLQPNGKGANADTGCVIDRIGDCRGCANIAELAQALDARRIDPVVLFGQQNHLELVDVGVYRAQICRKIVIDVAGLCGVELGCPVQRRTNAPDRASHELTASGAGIDDVTAGKGADNARHADFAGAGMDPDLDKLGAEGKL